MVLTLTKNKVIGYAVPDGQTGYWLSGHFGVASCLVPAAACLLGKPIGEVCEIQRGEHNKMRFLI